MPNYDVNYEDERFAKVEAEEQEALTELEQTYGDIIGNTDKYYQDQIDASKDWADKQSQLQQEQTDFTIEQIEQQKGQAQKDYTKEQSGAYVDWQKQSNQYGANAEAMASSGMAGTGFSESSQVSMYNTYQNRVATARESYNQAVLNYNNAIKDARLQNNAVLAEIAANALQTQLELSLQAFQYKNTLTLELADKKLQTKEFYSNEWQKVLNQINTEHALAEEVRQFDETMEYNTTQAELNRQHDAQQAELDRQHTSSENQKSRDFQAAQAELERNFEAQQAEISRQFQEAQAAIDRQHDYDLLKAKTKAEKELADKEHKLALEKLAKQQEYAMEQLAQEQKNKVALLEKEYALSKSSSSGNIKNNSSSSSSSSSNKNGSISNSSSSVEIDMASVLALGYGPISSSRLAELVSTGVVTYTIKNGKKVFSKVGKGGLTR